MKIIVFQTAVISNKSSQKTPSFLELYHFLYAHLLFESFLCSLLIHEILGNRFLGNDFSLG